MTIEKKTDYLRKDEIEFVAQAIRIVDIDKYTNIGTGIPHETLMGGLLLAKAAIEAIDKYREKKANNPSLPPDFVELWEIFPRPRRGSKQKSYLAYRSALKRDSAGNILGGARAYASSEEASKFPKGLAAWLNDDRWTSDYRGIEDGIGARQTTWGEATRQVALDYWHEAQREGEGVAGNPAGPGLYPPETIRKNGK